MTKPNAPPDLRASFDAGVAAALDPVNAAAVTGGRAVTSRRSYWLFDRCPVCQHTFRPGDEVQVADDRSVRHAMPTLPCAEGKPAPTADPVEAAAFFAGLNSAWPLPTEGACPVRLEAGHELLAEARDGHGRHTCAVCCHTFRLNECVVICPCSPEKPLCGAAIHRDRVQGLHCWESWSPGESMQYCPITSRRRPNG
jgi:hypothetical protein